MIYTTWVVKTAMNFNFTINSIDIKYDGKDRYVIDLFKFF